MDKREVNEVDRPLSDDEKLRNELAILEDRAQRAEHRVRELERQVEERQAHVDRLEREVRTWRHAIQDTHDTLVVVAEKVGHAIDTVDSAQTRALAVR